jgi:hypothetical protein
LYQCKREYKQDFHELPLFSSIVFQDLTSRLPSDGLGPIHPITLALFGSVPRVEDLCLHMRRHDPASVVGDCEVTISPLVAIDRPPMLSTSTKRKQKKEKGKSEQNK